MPNIDDVFRKLEMLILEKAFEIDFSNRSDVNKIKKWIERAEILAAQSRTQVDVYSLREIIKWIEEDENTKNENTTNTAGSGWNLPG